MYKEHYYQTDDGLTLYLREYQAKNWSHETLPVICLPGLSRNSRDFDKIASALSHQFDQNFRLITLDYRGRGHSEWDENKKNYNIVYGHPKGPLYWYFTRWIDPAYPCDYESRRPRLNYLQ